MLGAALGICPGSGLAPLAEASESAEESEPAEASESAASEVWHALLLGRYLILGRDLQSGVQYSGTLELTEDELGFTAYRVWSRTCDPNADASGGPEVRETARGAIETTADGSAVLRLRWFAADEEREATYLLGTDLDNYGRLTGYVYPLGGVTTSPVLEVWFAAEPLERAIPQH
ncbi:MAG: hypothetical protein R3E12_04005 [Candidatus Eisenbacteria bacterium]